MVSFLQRTPLVSRTFKFAFVIAVTCDVKVFTLVGWGVPCFTICNGDTSCCRKKPQALGLLRFCLLFPNSTLFEKSNACLQKDPRSKSGSFPVLLIPTSQRCGLVWFGLVKPFKPVMPSPWTLWCWIECFQHEPQDGEGTISYSGLCKARQRGEQKERLALFCVCAFPWSISLWWLLQQGALDQVA